MSLMDASDEIDTTTAGLESAKAEWQRRIARKMMSLVTAEPPLSARLVKPRARRRLPFWITAPAAATALAGLVLAAPFLWHILHPTEAQLMARSYNEQRTLILRIPGGDPVPLASGTRGGTGAIAEPVELLEVRLRAEKHLRENPGSAYWHQVLGEVNLLELDGSAAQNNLDTAYSLDPNLPEIQTDRAAAAFEIGETSGEKQYYADAADEYGIELLAHPSALLYFNRAICWERLGLTDKAADDLRQALALEHSAAWRKAIETEIEALKGKSSQLDPGGKAAIARNDAASSGGAAASENYESGLAQATELLAQWGENPAARSSLLRVADLGLNHHDFWLKDWIRNEHTPTSASGDRKLAEAVSTGASGDAEQSLADGRLAAAFYRETGNLPGLLRSQLAQVYAFQRLDRVRECLAGIDQIEHEEGLERYAWLKTQLALEEGSCRGLSGQYDSAESAFRRAISESTEFQLNSLHLRALGAEALLLEFRGAPSRAWQLDVEAMALCSSFQCPPIRKYQLFYNMAHGADDLGLHSVAFELMRTGEQAAADSGDVTAHAYALETLAIMSGHLGNYNASDTSFSAAQNLAQQGFQPARATLYQAEWQADHAEVLLRKGDRAGAMSLLNKSGAALLNSDYQPGLLKYWTELSAVQLAAGDRDEALTSASAAVAAAEKSLPTLNSAMERQQWQRENAPPYAQLVLVLLERGENLEAFKQWERFRSLPFAIEYERGPEISAGLTHSHSEPSAARCLVLVLAPIGDSYVGWLVSPQPLQVLRTAVLGNRADVRRLATNFFRLCSDRDSDLADVQSIGGILFSRLLSPFADALYGSTPLYLDVDSSLETVPFSALRLPNGAWLGRTRTLPLLPPWWSLDPAVFTENEALPRASRVMVVNGFGGNSASDGAESNSEAAAIARLAPNPILLSGSSAAPEAVLKELPTAEVFHFSGHAVSGDSPRFLLNAGDGRPPQSLSADALGSLDLHRCRIAVLAACNTTASDPGRIEPVFDLRNALLGSGAHGVIASNWDVDDRSTQALMLAFYRQLFQGVAPGQSLQRAEQTVSTDPNWQHPYYWASFQLFVN
jgi:CHAT domain-containing protein/tetratricopeptide (TPR) repeat protein